MGKQDVEENREKSTNNGLRKPKGGTLGRVLLKRRKTIRLRSIKGKRGCVEEKGILSRGVGVKKKTLIHKATP